MHALVDRGGHPKAEGSGKGVVVEPDGVVLSVRESFEEGAGLGVGDWMEAQLPVRGAVQGGEEAVGGEVVF